MPKLMATLYWESLAAAQNYYLQYFQHSKTPAEVRVWCENEIKNDRVRIGRPTVSGSNKLFVDKYGRYVIEE